MRRYFFLLLLLPLSLFSQEKKSINNNVDNEAWDYMQVGDILRPNSHLLLPAGQTLELPSNDRVLNMDFVHHKKYMVVKTNRHISIIDTRDFRVIANHAYPVKEEVGSMNGLAIAEDDSTVYFTGLEKNLYVGKVGSNGGFKLVKTIALSTSGKVNPLGIALNKNRAFIALAITNQVAIVDVINGKILHKIDVGVCPYAITISKDGKYAFISNFGGPHPGKNDKTEKSAGTKVAVDERSVALRGSVSVIDLASNKKVEEVITGIHPEAMTLSPDGKLLYVTDESGDGISLINTTTFKVEKKINTKPSSSLPYGSLTNALAFSGDGKILFAANAGNNAIALIDAKAPEKGPYGFIAAGGFPGAICLKGNELFIGNVTPLKGAVQKVPLPANKAELEKYTREAEKGYHLIEILRAQASGRSDVKPKPIPEQVGEPSSIKHVVYIIKENKKFDQVLGDMGRGNADPSLVEFGRNITPNTHSLADKYVLLDNYYCNGVNSSDGHQWAIQGITNPYHEKDFSNGHCAYEFGVDPLNYAGCGFIWDHLLRKGISFRNFGETDLAEITRGETWTDQYNSWMNKNDSAQFKCDYQIETLRKYSDLRFPGWNMNIPDQVRADAFLNALKEYEEMGSLPEFIIIYLPNDHTSGYSESSPTPRAYVADNDLAMGRIVEALSKSPFWKDMAVFINEDDPQSGTDHVDGRRSLCLVAGPYVKRDTVISRFYNQSSILHTICRIFGVQPMNQLVAAAPVMSECFNDTPQYEAYFVLTPAVPINEMNPPKNRIKSKATARLAPLTTKMDFSKPDLIDKDALVFSKYVWSTVHGDKPFPVKYFGAHGKGLKKLGLKGEKVDGEKD
jgi:YVTN family beta-propeller protein